MSSLTKKERRMFMLGLVVALLLAILSNLFVTSFFEVLRASRYNFAIVSGNILIISSILLALLFDWFFKKI